METIVYKIDKNKEFEQISQKAIVGYLGIITPDGYPRVVPMNFATENKTIFFHGRNHGEKFDYLKSGSRVTFSLDTQYSITPSYWTSDKSACPITMLFKSALVKGTSVLLDDIEESVHGLQLLMDKYQPDKGYTEMRPDERIYREIFKETAVFKIIPDSVSVKVKFRQKKSKEYNRKLVKKLEMRAQGPDLDTAREIRKMLGDNI
ncbi:MAG: pyridoxamine 5'-phosphate oxidase family protein [candidate division Zixibacteria bacterium]|nr:pyridoxamine 5'-phosphate oxidase family protein [candidate division Zixibacteria bacterium]